MKNLKQELERRFYANYTNGERLLAIQLNGFTHSIFFDYKDKDEPILIERVSDYLSPLEKSKSFTQRAKNVLIGLSHYIYQNNAKEIVYFAPSER